MRQISRSVSRQSNFDGYFLVCFFAAKTGWKKKFMPDQMGLFDFFVSYLER